MEISACPVCGSKNIGIGTLGDGIISGLSSWNEVCRNCGYQGASLVFTSDSEYQRFVETISQKKQRGVITGDPSEEEPQDGDGENTIIYSEKKSYLFEAIISVVLAIVFFIILSGSNYLGGYSYLFSQNNSDFLIVSIIGSFVGVFLFFFLLILLGETLYRSIRSKKK